MPINRSKVQGVILVEDRRTEMFFRRLLDRLGFAVTSPKIRIEVAARGEGDAKKWIRKRYPEVVKLLRRKRNENRFLITVCDGDNDGPEVRKTELDEALGYADMDRRNKNEHIALPVPTWSIETWLLALLGDNPIDESTRQKHQFEQLYRGNDERQAIRTAVEVWLSGTSESTPLPSLVDGKAEMERISFV